MKNPSTNRMMVLACLLLAGCVQPDGFKSSEEWRMGCIRQGGEPIVAKTSQGLSFICIRTEALIKVKP